MGDMGQWGWEGKASASAQILKKGCDIRDVISSKDELPRKDPQKFMQAPHSPTSPNPWVLWRCVSHASELQRSKRAGRVTSSFCWALAEFSSPLRASQETQVLVIGSQSTPGFR